MTPAVANLIATAVTRGNAGLVEEACQVQLCLAEANRDLTDFLAVQGKLYQARAVQMAPVVFGQPGFGLVELLRCQ